MIFDTNAIGEQFGKTADELNSLSTYLFPGAPKFARHMLQAQLEVLKGIESLLHSQLENIDRQFPAKGAAGGGTAKATPANHAPERVRVAVTEEEHQAEQPAQ